MLGSIECCIKSNLIGLLIWISVLTGSSDKTTTIYNQITKA